MRIFGESSGAPRDAIQITEGKSRETHPRMIAVQPELNLVTPAEREPSAVALQCLRNGLADLQWHTAKELAARFDVSDRELRAVAEFHGEEFVSGNKGYRLMSAATIDEIRQCAGRLQSQVTKMQARIVQLTNAAHRRLHQGPEVGGRGSEVGQAEPVSAPGSEVGQAQNFTTL
jgi:hypothetical protein